MPGRTHGWGFRIPYGKWSGKSFFWGKKKPKTINPELSLSEPFMYYILLSASRVKNHGLELIKMLPIWIVLKDNLY